MLRRLALLLAALSVVVLATLAACGGTKDFTFDAGFIDAGGCFYADGGPVPAPTGGPCDVYAQSNCACGQKCTIEPDGSPVCGSAGDGADYADCADDSKCKPGTACVDLTYTGFVRGKHCYPFCNPATLDAGTNTCPGLDAGAQCLTLLLSDGGLSIPEGFCDLPSADGG